MQNLTQMDEAQEHINFGKIEEFCLKSWKYAHLWYMYKYPVNKKLQAGKLRKIKQTKHIHMCKISLKISTTHTFVKNWRKYISRYYEHHWYE